MKKLLLNLLLVGLSGSAFLSATMSASAQNIDITEVNNNVMGNNMEKVEGARSKRSVSDSTLLPRIDFIDISSWNGELSVESFEMMKFQGVKGVVVKLTEYTTYKNPFAKIQIENAKKAGLTVSTYHYSWFVDEQKAVEEANYFADYAEELGLNKTTVMVNDAEEAELIPADVTITSIAFKNQLNKRGFNNVIHYSMASWFTSNYMEFSVLGKENCWVAEWPSKPSNENLLYADTTAWQWSSKVEFPGVSGFFDASVDYLSRFISESEGILLSVGVQDYTPYIYLNLTPEQFNDEKRFIVYLDGHYYFETYKGVNYYSQRMTIEKGLQQVSRKFEGEKGQKIEVFEASGKPGTSSTGKVLLETLALDKSLDVDLPDASNLVQNITYDDNHLRINYDKEGFESKYRMGVFVNDSYTAEVYDNVSYYANVAQRTPDFIQTSQKLTLKSGDVVSVVLMSGKPGQQDYQLKRLQKIEVD